MCLVMRACSNCVFAEWEQAGFCMNPANFEKYCIPACIEMAVGFVELLLY